AQKGPPAGPSAPQPGECQSALLRRPGARPGRGAGAARRAGNVAHPNRVPAAGAVPAQPGPGREPAIFLAVWGCDFGPHSNNLWVYMSYLRAKHEAGREPRILQTVRGLGYVLRDTP